METRKSPKADLEKKRTFFLQTGLIIAISLALVAFEWRTPYGNPVVFPDSGGIEPETDFIEIVPMKKPEPPKPQNVTLLKIVDTSTDDFPEIDIITEIGLDEKLEPYVLPKYTEEVPDNSDPEILYIAQEMPSFPGGESALFDYLRRNIDYPVQAREAGISGVVYIGFVVEADGSISTVTVQRELAGGCTEEAVRVISQMPKWNPGKQRGKPVRVRLSLPVRFTLVG
mgnify:CR=1 FL=1